MGMGCDCPGLVRGGGGPGGWLSSGLSVLRCGGVKWWWVKGGWWGSRLGGPCAKVPWVMGPLTPTTPYLATTRPPPPLLLICRTVISLDPYQPSSPFTPDTVPALDHLVPLHPL